MENDSNAPDRFSDEFIGNVYCMHRESLFHEIVGAGQPMKPHDAKRGAWSKFEAWSFLVRCAQYKDSEKLINGHKVGLERGDVIGGYSTLGQIWNWSPKQVRTFIERLKNWNMVRPKVGNEKGKGNASHKLVLTLCNYDRYQLKPSGLIERKGQAKGQGKGKRRATIYNKDNKYNNKYKGRYSDQFEDFWSVYSSLAKQINSRPGTKSEAYDEWEKMDTLDQREAREGAAHYQQSCKQVEQPMKHACRYLRYRGWEGLSETQESGKWFDGPEAWKKNEGTYAAILADKKPNGHWLPDELGPVEKWKTTPNARAALVSYCKQRKQGVYDG